MSFFDVLRGELAKARTLRPVVRAVLSSVALSLAYCLIEASPDLGFTTPETAGVHALANLSFLAAVVGVLVVSGEHAGGQLTTTVLAAPRRGRVLAAKLLIASGLTTALGLLLAVLVATLVQAPLGDRSVWTTGNGGTLLASLALGVVSWTALGLLSACAAFLVRSQTAVLTGMIVLTFGGVPLMMALPVFQYLPASAAVLLFVNREQQTSDWLNPPDLTVAGAGATVALWCVAAVVSAAVVFVRRDVGARQAVVE
ncbi:hypothetical protein [Nonomuraea sp. NPDC049725]|uniref:hypothetical protein n=1 Tax=Nonomuraea sp. NPDC049725 TaxID=3154508 RepID=UPI0034266951